MAANIYTNHVLAKKQCPYMEKCYRKNPIHFNEMSHPHLENIVMDQLDGEIQVPVQLDFECSDRSLLIDQLKVLQVVLRRNKSNGENNLISKQPNSELGGTSSSAKNENNTISQTLKHKVERHKQTMTQRRENKLKEMDDQAKELFNSTNENTKVEQSKISKMKEELDNLKIIAENIEKTYSSQDKKRSNNDFDDNNKDYKKSKPSHSKHEDIQDSSQGTHKNTQNSESRRGTSIIEVFEATNSAKSRSAVREKAIKMLRQQGFDVQVVEPGNFALKYALSAPYHFFLSRVDKSKPTYDQSLSITVPEILDVSLGEIVKSLQINFMVDVGWLCLQYLLAGQCTNMTILLGERIDQEKLSSNITVVPVKPPTKFGCHHSKVMILKYKDNGIRVVVSTANLYSDDWENRTQGIWISPHLPPLSESADLGDGESPTDFKKDLERYLTKYNQPVLAEWISSVKKADFSSVNVFFLASVPGRHTDREQNFWGHRKLGIILSKHAELPPDAKKWTLVAQSSSIGSLGPNYESWIQKDITYAMSKEKPGGLKSQPNFKFIYPSLNNYKESFDCQVGSCCLPYGLQTHSKQEWIKSYMCQWKATRTARNRAMPHIKSYTRFSPDFKQIPWFVLTSANLSKAAWGVGGQHFINLLNYEAGVVFLPKFINGSTTFPIQEEEPGVPIFPIPYDVPPTQFEADDKPFVTDFFNT